LQNHSVLTHLLYSKEKSKIHTRLDYFRIAGYTSTTEHGSPFPSLKALDAERPWLSLSIFTMSFFLFQTDGDGLSAAISNHRSHIFVWSMFTGRNRQPNPSIACDHLKRKQGERED